jgi:hypothetical protein
MRVALRQHSIGARAISSESARPGDHDAVVARRGPLHQPLEILEAQIVVLQRMGEIEDRVVAGLAVNARERDAPSLGERIERHAAALADGRQLRRVAEQRQHPEDFLQILEHAVVEHRGLVDQPDIDRLVAPLPAGDEIRPADSRRRQRRRRRFVQAEGRDHARDGGLVHALDLRGRPLLLGQPGRQLLIGRVVERRVEHAVHGGRRRAAGAQHRGGLVGGREHRIGRAASPAALPFSADRLEALLGERGGEMRQQRRLARAGLAEHRQRLGRAVLRLPGLPARFERGETLRERRDRRRLILGELHFAAPPG